MVYFGFWLLFHSEGVITLLFTDQRFIYQKYGMLKNEYIYEYFFGPHFNDCWWYVRVMLTFLLTFLYIKYFAKVVLNPLYKVELEYKYERKKEKLKKEIELQKEKNRLNSALERAIKGRTKIEKAQKEMEAVNPEEKWEKEYQEFISSDDGQQAIKDLMWVYYDNNRRLMDNLGEKLLISRKSASICESYGLLQEVSTIVTISILPIRAGILSEK